MVAPGLLDRVRDLDDHLAALDAARPGHDRDPFAADGRAVGLDDRVLVAEVAAGQLVRLHDAHALLDAVHDLEGGALQQIFIRPDDADDGACFTTTQVDLVAQIFNSTDDGFDIARLGALFHDDDHGGMCSLIQ